MSQYLFKLFELEKCLLEGDSVHFLEKFKSLLSTNQTENKETLINNPGLTLYLPQKTNNLQSEKNILLLIHELSRTGAPVVAADTAKILIKNGFFVTVVTMRRGPLLKELLDSGIPVIFNRELALLHDSKELMSSKSNHLSIDTLINSFSQTIIITAVYYNLIRRYAKKTNPIIWWLHEGASTYDFLNPLMPKHLGSSIKVYTGGQYAADQLKKFGLFYKTKVLNYGVTDIYETTKSIPHSLISFILPGSIGKRKGQATLLEAIEKLPEEYRNMSEFIFIGDIVSAADEYGKDVKSRLEKAAKQSENIKYLTSVTREELFNIYQKTDVLVLPSIDDPMPVVATEALMLEKIVLCSNTTGTSYYLEDGKNGFIFESDNSDELCDKIKYIITHREDLQTIGQNGRKVYQENFDMNIFEKNLLRTIKETK